jgi:NADP-dependent 3-hydroxy acid dehydrogenase YdfG
VTRLEGAVVALTGGARGIGLATAQALSSRGARVHIGDLDTGLSRCEARRLGLRSGHALDVADRHSFAAFVDAVEAADGPIDVLVNNAGVMPLGSFLDEDEDVTGQTLAVNLVGVLNGMRLVLPGMAERREGRVVNVASLAARLPVPRTAVYSGAKAAVVAITDAVRRELRGTGVELTAVLPTVVATELMSGLPSGRGVHLIEPSDVAKTIVRSLGRPGGTVVAGPAWLDLFSRLMTVAPRRVNDFVRTVIGDDRALSAGELAARAPYDARLAGARAARPTKASEVTGLWPHPAKADL